jgi:hypothetical protein
MSMPEGTSLHDLCVDVSGDLAQIQHGLATAGASPQATQAIEHMRQIVEQMAITLAKAPDVEEAAKSGPAAGPQGPMAPQGPPSGAPPAAQGPPNNTPGARGGPPPSGPFGAAAQQLHQDMQGNAQGAAR